MAKDKKPSHTKNEPEPAKSLKEIEAEIAAEDAASKAASIAPQKDGPPVVAAAVVADAPKGEPHKPKLHRVKQKKTFSLRGQIHTWQAGEICDPTHHGFDDAESLSKATGVELEPVE